MNYKCLHIQPAHSLGGVVVIRQDEMRVVPIQADPAVGVFIVVVALRLVILLEAVDVDPCPILNSRYGFGYPMAVCKVSIICKVSSMCNVLNVVGVWRESFYFRKVRNQYRVCATSGMGFLSTFATTTLTYHQHAVG